LESIVPAVRIYDIVHTTLYHSCWFTASEVVLDTKIRCTTRQCPVTSVHDDSIVGLSCFSLLQPVSREDNSKRSIQEVYYVYDALALHTIIITGIYTVAPNWILYCTRILYGWRLVNNMEGMYCLYYIHNMIVIKTVEHGRPSTC